MTEPGSIGLGVIGAGRIGAVHVRNIADGLAGAHLIGVADVDAKAARHLIKEVGQGRADDVDGLLRDPDVQGLVIATPTATHAELIARAARARKHVLCEKPISLRLDTTRSAIEAARAAGIILQVGFQRRFDDEFAHAKATIAEGILGSIRFLRLVGRDHRMPSIAYLRTSGGQYRDQMIHEFDMARWLLAPRAVVDVYATGSALIDPALATFQDVDTSVACLRFDDGTLAIIDGSRETAYGYDVRAEICGSKAMLLIGNVRFAGKAIMDRRAVTPEVESFIERFAGAYREEVSDFVAVIREKRAPRAGGDDALEALRIALAADRSLREGIPVKVADVDDA